MTLSGCYNIGNIYIGDKKEIILPLELPIDREVEIDIDVTTKWIELLSAKRLNFSPGEKKDISICVNSINASPGDLWGQLVLADYTNKEVFYKKVLIASFLRLNDGPSIKVEGDGVMEKNIKIKVIGEKLDFFPVNHFITIRNESGNMAFKGCIFTNETWLQCEYKEISISPKETIELQVFLDIQEICKKKLNYAEGIMIIKNNSINNPKIISTFKVSPIYDYLPYPEIEPLEMNFENIKPGKILKEINISNCGSKILNGFILLPEWIYADNLNIEVSSEQEQIVTLNLNIPNDMEDKTEIRDKIELIFNEPCEIRKIEIPVFARVDKRELMINLSTKKIDFGNIIKYNTSHNSFKLSHNDFEPVKVKMTSRDKWLRLISVTGDGKDINVENNNLEFDIFPDENCKIDFLVDTRLCSSNILYTGEVKLEFPGRDVPNEFVKVILKPFDVKNFFVHFEDLKIDKIGNNNQEAELKYGGVERDIVLRGSVVSLEDWIKIDEPEFVVKYGEPAKIKADLSGNGNIKGRTEGNILITYYPEKCFPVMNFIPHQVEKLVFMFKDEKIEDRVIKKSAIFKIFSYIRSIFSS